MSDKNLINVPAMYALEFSKAKAEYFEAMDQDRDGKVILDRYVADNRISQDLADTLTVNYLTGTQTHMNQFFNAEIKRVRTIVDFENEPGYDYVLERLGIVKGDVVLLCAKGNSGKTMLVQNLAFCFATGQKYLGQFECSKEKVMHIDREQGEKLTTIRYNRIARGFGYNGRLNVDRVTMSLYLDDPTINTTKMREEFTNFIKPYGVVFIDSLKKISCTDENSSEMSTIMSTLKECAEKANTAIVLIHHQGKANNSNVKQSGRGSSAIYDGACTQIDLDYKKGVYYLTCAKSRGLFFDDLAYVIKDEGEKLKSHRCTEKLVFEAAKSESQEKEDSRKIEILSQIMKTPGISQGNLKAELKMNVSDLKKLTEEYEFEGLVDIEIGKANKHSYSLTAAGESFLENVENS